MEDRGAEQHRGNQAGSGREEVAANAVDQARVNRPMKRDSARMANSLQPTKAPHMESSMAHPGGCRGAVFSQTSVRDHGPVRRIPAASSEAGSSPLKASTSSKGMVSAAASSSGSRAHSQERRDAGLRNGFCKITPVSGWQAVYHRRYALLSCYSCCPKASTEPEALQRVHVAVCASHRVAGGRRAPVCQS